jgi:hypothetical protein
MGYLLSIRAILVKMSSYMIPAWDPLQIGKVGWNGQWNSYWFEVFKLGPFGETDMDDPEITFTMGVDDPWRKISNVGDLLMFTWGEIEWQKPEGLYAIRGLRDDPIYEALHGGELEPQEGIEDFVMHAFDSQAITAANDAIRGHSEPPLPPPWWMIRSSS